MIIIAPEGKSESSLIFDLIELTEDYKEKELENKILEKLKNVLLELNSCFSFVGNQYKITIDNQDFYIDLFFIILIKMLYSSRT